MREDASLPDDFLPENIPMTKISPSFDLSRIEEPMDLFDIYFFIDLEMSVEVLFDDVLAHGLIMEVQQWAWISQTRTVPSSPPLTIKLEEMFTFLSSSEVEFDVDSRPSKTPKDT